MGTNVSENTATGSTNYPIHWHVKSYQDFSAVFIQMTVVYGVFLLIVRSLSPLVEVQLDASACTYSFILKTEAVLL